KLDDPITLGIFCAWRKHFNHQVWSACHALSSGDFRAPCLADKDQVRNDPAEFTEDHTRPRNHNTDRIVDKIGAKGHLQVMDDTLVGNAWSARHEEFSLNHLITISIIGGHIEVVNRHKRCNLRYHGYFLFSYDTTQKRHLQAYATQGLPVQPRQSPHAG